PTCRSDPTLDTRRATVRSLSRIVSHCSSVNAFGSPDPNVRHVPAGEQATAWQPQTPPRSDPFAPGNQQGPPTPPTVRMRRGAGLSDSDGVGGAVLHVADDPVAGQLRGRPPDGRRSRDAGGYACSFPARRWSLSAS